MKFGIVKGIKNTKIHQKYQKTSKNIKILKNKHIKIKKL